MQALVMVGLNLLLSAALWGVGMLLRKPSHTVSGEVKNREIQISTYGAPKRLLYGQCKVALELVYCDKLKPVYVTTEVGKGGGDTQTQVLYTLCFAGILGIAPDTATFGEFKLIKLWTDDKLRYNVSGDNDKVVQGKWVKKKLKFYPGTATQLPDPMIEAKLGAGNVPGYRHKPLISITDINVTQFGNRPPTIRALIAPGTASAVGNYPVTGVTQLEFHNDPIGEYDDCGIILTQNEQYIIMGLGWWDEAYNPYFTWRKISTYNRTVISERTYAFPEPDCTGSDTPWYYFQGFDVDENDLIYAASCEGYGPMTRLDSDTFTVQATGPADLPGQTERIRVSRNPLFPYLYSWRTGLFAGLDSVWLHHRDTLANPFNSAEMGHEFPPPTSAVNPYAGAVNHSDGSLFCIWTDPSPVTVYLSRLYPDGRRVDVNITAQLTGLTDTGSLRDYLCYDQESDQVIIGSESGSHDCLWFLDASAYTLNQKMTSCGPLYDNGLVDFDRGVVSGYLYINRENHILTIDVNNYEIVDDLDITSLTGAYDANGIIYCAYKHSIFTLFRADGYDMQEILLGRITAGTALLSNIVNDICKRDGLAAGQLNVAQLTDEVKGYVVDQDQSAREALEPLMEAFIFDGVEQDGDLVFVKRGGPSVLVIPEGDLAAHRFGDERPEPLEIEMPDESELPRRVEVHYPDLDRKHEAGVQHYGRQVTDSRLIKKIQPPVLMDKNYAKQLAHVAMKYDWQAKPCTLSLGPKYARLMPTDVVTVAKSEGNYRVLLLEAQREGLLTHWKGLVEALDYTDPVQWQGAWSGATTYATDDAVAYNDLWYVSLQDNNLNHLPTDTDWWAPYDPHNLYQSTLEGNPGPDVDEEVDFPGPSLYQLMDLPPLLDTHNAPSIYLASGAMFAAWHGCTVHVSKDSGDTWAGLKSVAERAMTGTSLAALGDFAYRCRDRANTLTVRWDYDGDALATVTESQLLQGQGHYLLVGEEIICARDVATNGDGSQTFSNLIRGCKGTEYAMTGHTAGERVVRLNMTSVVLASLDLTYLNQSYLYNGVSNGDDWEDGSRKIVTTELRTLKPWAPVQAEGARDGSNNLTITWVRRNRLFGPSPALFAGIEIAMSESSEDYEVDIMSGDTVLRTIDSLSTEEASYTAAEQTTDGLTPGDPVACRIYQISATVGRGWPLEATV